MINVLWHLRGAAPLKGVSADAALDGIEGLLAKQRKPLVERNNDQLIFDAPFWEHMLGPNWSAMVIYDWGRFCVDRDLSGGQLHYELRSFHVFVFCLLGAAMFFAFGLADGGVIGGLKLATLAFAWIYGMNVLLTLVRVPRLIRKAARRA
jgi:hypothetical protein